MDTNEHKKTNKPLMTGHKTHYLEGIDKSYCITWYTVSKFQLAPGIEKH